MAIDIELDLVHQTSHTIFDTEDVVVHGVDSIIERRVIGTESRGLESTEVERNRWMEFSRVEPEWNQ